ncbi:MAG: EF-P lysine aminoacylase EpmA [Thiohalomonadales bacterium]
MIEDVDSTDWRPCSSIDIWRQRGQLYRQIREFFYQRDVLEVDTPILSRFGNTDPQIESFVTHDVAYDHRDSSDLQTWYLHTSPEFAMKRLLAAETCAIYQLCKVFRREESGRYHNPEFTLLEWYRPGLNYHELMNEVAELVSLSLEGSRKLDPCEKITYQQAFVEIIGIDPLRASVNELSNFVHSQQQSVQGLEDNDKDLWLDLIMGQFVQPRLGQNKLSFVYDFPASKAALANIRSGAPPLAERFELFLDGIELANGYQELTDAQEVLRRFKNEQFIRSKNTQLAVDFDSRLISACSQGLPQCSGVAMGIDRLLLIITRQKTLKYVLAFCRNNA